jgi:hypothetical protein
VSRYRKPLIRSETWGAEFFDNFQDSYLRRDAARTIETRLTCIISEPQAESFIAGRLARSQRAILAMEFETATAGVVFCEIPQISRPWNYPYIDPDISHAVGTRPSLSRLFRHSIAGAFSSSRRFKRIARDQRFKSSTRTNVIANSTISRASEK